MNDFELSPEEFERRLMAAQAETEQPPAVDERTNPPQPADAPRPRAGTEPDALPPGAEKPHEPKPWLRFCVRVLVAVPAGIFVWTAAVLYSCHSLNMPGVIFPLFARDTVSGTGWLARALAVSLASLSFAALLLGSLHGLVLAWGEAWSRKGKTNESTTSEKIMLALLVALLILATLGRLLRVRPG
jgi:hypothetical protein